MSNVPSGARKFFRFIRETKKYQYKKCIYNIYYIYTYMCVTNILFFLFLL